jgi:hypothetical protein
MIRAARRACNESPVPLAQDQQQIFREVLKQIARRPMDAVRGDVIHHNAGCESNRSKYDAPGDRNPWCARRARSCARAQRILPVAA